MQTKMPDAALRSDLTIRSATTRIVKVPLRFTLGTSADIVFVYPRHTRRPRRLRALEDFVIGCFRAATEEKEP